MRYGGRTKGTPNKATVEIRDLVRTYVPGAVKELARLAKSAKSEQARVAAIKELIDRGYGKAVQTLSGDPEGGPIRHQIEIEYVGSGPDQEPGEDTGSI